MYVDTLCGKETLRWFHNDDSCAEPQTIHKLGEQHISNSIIAVKVNQCVNAIWHGSMS